MKPPKFAACAGRSRLPRAPRTMAAAAPAALLLLPSRPALKHPLHPTEDF